VNTRGLQIANDILFRIFWIGFGFYLISLLLFLPFKAHWYAMLTLIWQISNTGFLDMVTISFFALVKFVLIFYVLVPALAIRWTLCRLEKKA
jgi:hypothetical protein